MLSICRTSSGVGPELDCTVHSSSQRCAIQGQAAARAGTNRLTGCLREILDDAHCSEVHSTAGTRSVGDVAGEPHNTLPPRNFRTVKSLFPNWTKRLRRGMGGASWVGCADWEEAGRREILV